ncbi:serine/threonine protein phosphatase [Coprothermobacteraceae bacterium]|nr:serine/threonine protein phosphatase [Coprothermobacteraceae bacterium]
MQNRLGRATLILAVIGFLCMAGVMFWVFSQHGSRGLFNWNYDYRSLFNYLWALTFAIPASVLITYSIRRKSSRAVFNLLKIIVVLLSLAGIGVSLYAGLYGIVIPAHSLLPSYEPVLMVEPYNGANGIPNLYVHFATSTPTQVGLVWGTEQTSSSIVEEQPLKQHFFRLSDLQPGQTYFYALNNGPKRWFKTPSLSNNATLTVFAVAADAHYGNENASPTERSEILKTVNNDPSVDYFFIDGDVTELGMNNQNWSEFFKDFNANLSRPTAFVLGNHDALIGGMYHVDKYLYPEQVRIDQGNERYHRIDVGPVHFLLLDVLWGTEEFDTGQRRWLEEQLRLLPEEDWVVILSHCFYYASGNVETGRIWADHEDTIKHIVPLFERYKVDLVVSGHNHQMELLKKSGVTYAIASPMGGTLDKPRSILSPYSVWYSNETRGFLKVTVLNDKAILEFKDPSGRLLRQFVITQNH